MKTLRFVLLAVDNNDYQVEQVSSAQTAAHRLGIELQILHTEHDAIVQSQKILELVQRPAAEKPDAIFFEPVGTALAQPARAAAAAKVGWVVLNRENVEYVPDLRQQYGTAMFSITVDHAQVGSIEGEQIAKLMPKGGTVLYIEGPSDNNASVQRTQGTMSRKPQNVEIRVLRGRWTEESGYNCIHSWLKLSIANEVPIGVVAAQNDAMALGARKAFQDLPNGPARDRWLRVPFLGCDGLPNGGQKAVRDGLLTATVVIPPNAGQAVEAMAMALKLGKQPDLTIFTEPTSFPPLTSLAAPSGH